MNVNTNNDASAVATVDPKKKNADLRSRQLQLARQEEALAFVTQYILSTQEAERTQDFLAKLVRRFGEEAPNFPTLTSTSYVNTIPPEDQPEYPGDRAIERNDPRHSHE